MIHFAELIGTTTSFYDVDHKQVLSFLDTKIKPEQIDSDKKWITTWNDYHWRLKLFFRWLHNKKIKEIDGEEVKPEDEWKTPSFLQQIKKKKTKRHSPYLETEVWDRDELLTVVKYEQYNKLYSININHGNPGDNLSYWLLIQHVLDSFEITPSFEEGIYKGFIQ